MRRSMFALAFVVALVAVTLSVRTVAQGQSLPKSVTIGTNPAGTVYFALASGIAKVVSGGAGYQMVSALSGFTGFVGKIRDSPDDVTYGDLLTFTNVTAAPAAERLTNVADTVVDRYLCVTGTPTGAGSITVFVGFSRG